MKNLDDFELSYGSLKKIKKSKKWFDIGFSRPLCFWLFSQPKLVQTLQVGGVSESSRSPIHAFLKINAENEKIEVDAANPHLEIERMAKK